MSNPVDNPVVNIQVTPANIAATIDGRRDLLVGTVPVGATATLKKVYRNVEKIEYSLLETLFGANSDLFNRILVWKEQWQGSSRVAELTVIVTAEAESATKAAAGVVLTGTATADGRIQISPIDDKKFGVTVDIVKGDTAETIINRFKLRYNKLTTMPAVVVADLSHETDKKITFTAVDAGSVGNKYPIAVSQYGGAGISYELTGFSSGAGEADTTDLFDNVGTLRFTGINWPTAWISQLSVIETFLDNRLYTQNSIQDGQAFIGIDGTYSELLNLVNPLNKQVLTFCGNNTTDTAEHKGGSLLSPADWRAVMFMGIRSRRLTTGAPLTGYVTTTAPSDQIGGAALASLPYFNTPLDSISTTVGENFFTEAEQRDLEDIGFSIIGLNDTEDTVITGAFVTPYTNDATGADNGSFHYLNYVDTVSVAREIFYEEIKSRYKQTRMASGGTTPGRSAFNEAKLRADCKAIYADLGSLMLVEQGRDALKYFDDRLVIEFDKINGIAKVQAVLQIVVQGRVFDFVFNMDFN